MDVEVVVALIAAGASLVAAGWAVIDARSARAEGRQTEIELKVLESNLAGQEAERDARRDYDYEARKRLYAECEPLLFQLVELAEGGIRHVRGIARSARQGNLQPDGNGWLATAEQGEGHSRGYYFNSTLYRVVAPLAYVHLLRRALTTVDFTVDPELREQYRITRWLEAAITDDFDLALQEPPLPYDPNHPDAAGQARNHPAVYLRQGLYMGRRDAAAEALIVREKDMPPRCMSFGEFEDALGSEDRRVQEAFEPVADLFLRFHPATRPVLWRVLVAQVHLYDALVRSQMRKLAAAAGDPVPSGPPPLDPKSFDWRQSPEEASDEQVLVDPFRVAHKYIVALRDR